ncbi:PilZ domain-containing protein [Pseudomonas chlororaphis]|uniref:Pilus assembly protein PilZ n=1 Tax=Pseudomonas chlororaphis TaxID=587753 RepID=A0A1Q8EM28_9PSED|nr:PilZ domain-containing protein [Pseudomonas chlororaphis]OLF52846.1 pilus assembly protein PilZ [Pseudomonas chlororaphis]
MFTERRIERHQLPCFLKVSNRLTDRPIGYLGNVSEDGLMLISQLPMLVGADFELRLTAPGVDGRAQTIDIIAACRWCHEDVTPHHYDAGFVLLSAPPEYRELVAALRNYFSFYPLQTSA